MPRNSSPDQPWFAHLLDESRPWRSRTLLPLKPEDAHFAYWRQKETPKTFNTPDALEAQIKKPGAGQDSMIATPDYPRWYPTIFLWKPDDSKPMPLHLLAKPLLISIALTIAYLMRDQILPRVGRDVEMMILLALMWFGITPFFDALNQWWDSVKDRSPDRNRQQQVDIVLFRYWLAKASPWILYILLAVLSAIYLIQTQTSPRGVLTSVDAAALYKPQVAKGEWWRLITTGMMHGSIMHLLFNSMAVFYLGRVTLSLVQTPLLGLIFLASIIAGSLASYYCMPGDRSVGASGGILGILGFLTALAVYHTSGFPRVVRANLMQSLLLMSIFGALGAQYIDNAAHAGGFIMGTLLAVLLIPRTIKVWEYQTPKWLEMLGWACWLVLAVSTLHVAWILLA